MPWDFPNGPAPGAIFEPNGAGTEPKYTYNGAAWDYGATTELLISSVIPNAAICGSAALPAVRALGANFTNTCEILIDGTAVVTTFVSISELTFPINPVPETVPRTAVITVRDGATIGVGAVPFSFRIVTTYIWNIGIDETVPGTIDVRVANTNNEIGGITVVPQSDVQGLVLDTTTGALTAPLATPALAGSILEPPADSKGYVRQTTGAASTWVPPADTPTPDYGIGLTEDATATPTVVNLDIANTNGEIGGVMTEARTNIQGLNMDATGLITVPLGTDLLAGSIVEPLPDGLRYVRTRDLAGVSTWVTEASYTWGIGLDEVAPGSKNIDLIPAGDSPATLGGVYVIDRVRNNTEGLELGIDGRLRVPPATDSLLGGILEPPLDDKGYVRTYKGGVGMWVPPADPAPAPLAIEFVIPNTATIGAAPLMVEAHGAAFTAVTTIVVDGVARATTYVSPTELVFQIDPRTETIRTASITVNDGGTVGAGTAPFFFIASDKLYQGTWAPTTNTPDILIPPKGDKWMWVVDTADSRIGELVPTTIPGIAGMLTREGDHVVWDATANAFFLIATRALIVTDVVPSQMVKGAPPTQIHIYGAGFTATTQVLWEGVAVATTFLDDNKLRITVDQATMIPPTRDFVVVAVQDGALPGSGAAGFQFVEAGAAVFVGDDPPLPPHTQGRQWFESDTGRMFVWFDDTTSAQWVQTGGR